MYRLFLALRYLLSRPINLLGMAGVAVSVWALIVVVSIFSGFLVEIRAHVQSATSDLTVLRLPWPADYAEVARVLRADPNVAACAPRLVWYGLLHAAGAKRQAAPRNNPLSGADPDSPFVTLVGVDPQAEAKVTGFLSWLRAPTEPSLRVDTSHPLAPIDGMPAILLSVRRLTALAVTPGHRATVTSAQLRGPVFHQNLDFIDADFVIAGGYATRHTGFDSTTCFVDIDALRGLMGADAKGSASEVVVRCKDASRSAETAERLQRTLRDELPEPYRGVDVIPWQELNRGLLGAVNHQRGLMKLVLIVILVVAAFLLYATLSMMVTEKTRDIGILTAMGASRLGVMQVFLTCGLSIVAAGAALGVVAGCLSSIYLDDFNRWLRATFDIDLFPPSIYNLDHVPYYIDPLWILQVVSLAAIVGFLVSGLPAWRAARHDPVQSLRNE